MILTGENKVLGELPVPVSLCPPQIPEGVTWDRTRGSAVRGRRLTVCVMVRPVHNYLQKMLQVAVRRNLVYNPCICLGVSNFRPTFEPGTSRA
jgi:hypothetical protein